MARLGMGQGNPGHALGTVRKDWEGKLRHSSLVLQDYLWQPQLVWWQAEHLNTPKLRLVPLQAVISPALDGRILRSPPHHAGPPHDGTTDAVTPVPTHMLEPYVGGERLVHLFLQTATWGSEMPGCPPSPGPSTLTSQVSTAASGSPHATSPGGEAWLGGTPLQAQPTHQ